MGSKYSIDNINNIRFRASNSFFTNTQSVFVEYCDCVNLSYYTLLTFIQKSDRLNEKFTIDLIRSLDLPSLLIYYFNREYINPLVDLWRGDEKPMAELDAFLEDQMQSSNIFYDVHVDSNIVPMLNAVIGNEFSKRILIYNETDNKFIREDIQNTFAGKATFVYGDIVDVLKDTPKDSTYIFSDVCKVPYLVETDRINCSAIMLPIDYRYNYTDGTRSKYLVDMDYLQSKYVFKWSKYRI